MEMVGLSAPGALFVPLTQFVCHLEVLSPQLSLSCKHGAAWSAWEGPEAILQTETTFRVPLFRITMESPLQPPLPAETEALLITPIQVSVNTGKGMGGDPRGINESGMTLALPHHCG